MSQKPKRPRPTPRRPDKDEGKVVWVSCRAHAGCEGKTSKIAMKFKLPAGGTAIHYSCETCKGRFVVCI